MLFPEVALIENISHLFDFIPMLILKGNNGIIIKVFSYYCLNLFAHMCLNKMTF